MNVKRRIVTLVASGAVALGGVFGGAQVALADGPDTSPEVLAEIEAAEYPVLEQGDSSWEVAVVEFLLVDYGYFDAPEVDEDFDADLTDAVTRYQADNDLAGKGTVNEATWEQLRDDFGEVAYGDEGLRVTMAQYALAEGQDWGLSVTGEFDQQTKNFVMYFQENENIDIDPDGIVGPDTFKALLTLRAF